MEDFNSKYTGPEVEDLLDRVASGNAGGGGGGITAETDPVFLASPAASITDAKKEEWDNKVDKVNGKQLSTEDFTTALKTKLEGLNNYDDTELSNAIETLREDFDNIVSGDTTTAIKTFNEVIAFLEGIQDTQDLSSIIASIEQQIASKQDAISDLESIREGASKGATALQSIPEEYVTEDNLIWTKVEGEAGVRLKASVAMGDTCEASGTSSTAMGYKTKATGAYSSTFGQNTQATNEGEVAMGMYNKSTTSTDASEQTMFSFGIGTSDTNRANALEIKKNGDVYIGDKLLSSEGGADVYITDFDYLSLESLTRSEIQSLGLDKQGLMDALAAHKVILVPYEISDDTSFKGYCTLVGYYEDFLYIKVITDYIEIIIETSLDVQYIVSQEVTKRNWADKQDALKSGENIKTINGESILGSGDIEISGGSGGSSSSAKEFVVREPEYEPGGYTGSFYLSNPLEPNKVYVFSQPIASLQVNDINESMGAGDEYTIMFTASGSTIITIAGYQVYWANGTIPTIESGDMCELSLVRIGNVMKATLGIFKAV